ncbi:N-acyl-L-amino acid amidohydrolase [Synergistales bacterium]|nr:N-acyl-L-amino acid amidohydrolase [Synergistales bacterium]
MNSIGERARALNDKIVERRRLFHTCPEINLSTVQTEAHIVEELKKLGVKDIKQGLAEHGVTALIEGGKPGKVLGLRSDMDGLNILEDTGLPFASKNGNMHACGHDAHIAMLLGAAEILTENKDNLKGTVKLIFQPGEETTYGAVAMLKDGVLENPKVDAIIALHTGGLWSPGKPGDICYRPGPLMASSDFFTITFTGKGGHGATPHLTVDPIAMAAQAFTALQTIVSRETSPLDSAVVTIGAIHGGSAGNIIAPTCVLKGTYRALSVATRERLGVRIKELCEDIARGMRGSVEIEYAYGPPALNNDKEMTEKLRLAATEIVGAERVREIDEPTMGAEDMACYMEKIPGTFFYHPSFKSESAAPHHNPKFDIDESVLWIGSATLAQFALSWQ